MKRNRHEKGIIVCGIMTVGFIFLSLLSVDSNVEEESPDYSTYESHEQELSMYGGAND